MPRLIDLSQEIYQGMKVYPGHLKTVIWEHHTHEETVKNFEGGFSYQSRGLLMSDHGPTHVDALSHLDPRPDAPTIDKMSLDLFYGEATCIDVSHFEPRTYITDSDIDTAIEKSGADVRKGDILLFYTALSTSYTVQRNMSVCIRAWMSLQVCGSLRKVLKPLAWTLQAQIILPAVLTLAI